MTQLTPEEAEIRRLNKDLEASRAKVIRLKERLQIVTKIAFLFARVDDPALAFDSDFDIERY